MKPIRIAIGSLAIFVATFLPAIGEDKPSRLAIIADAPSFSLINQSGEKVASGDTRGKVCLVSFVFTTCNGTCPATTHRMSLVQQALKERNLTGKVRLVSITLDPARDTEEALH